MWTRRKSTRYLLGKSELDLRSRLVEVKYVEDSKELGRSSADGIRSCYLGLYSCRHGAI
jgi:hypothetical protein